MYNHMRTRSQVNIKGHALLTKHTLPFMKRAGGGSIVFQVHCAAIACRVRPRSPLCCVFALDNVREGGKQHVSLQYLQSRAG